MNGYERLLVETEINEIIVIEKYFKSKAKGLCKNNKIGISKRLQSISEKTCVLAEELGHYYTTIGDILDQSKIDNRKQERKARAWGYEKLVPINSLIQASKERVKNRHELAKYLNVTEKFLIDALKYYAEKYGPFYKFDNHVVYFEPLYVLKLLE